MGSRGILAFTPQEKIMQDHILKAVFSSERDDWETPAYVMDWLAFNFGTFTLDPCTWAKAAKAPTYYTPKEDGLKQSWQGHDAFVNPPYGANKTPKWVKYAWEQVESDFSRSTTATLLLPARTDTRWWHDCVARSSEVFFIKGRIYLPFA